MNEFEFIEKLKNKSSTIRNSQFTSRIGIGDDCAVLPKDAKTDLVITADLLIEDIDFRSSWSKPEFIGHKALAVSLSDVAAMGAKPYWAMLSIGIPVSVWKSDFVERFFDGWFLLAEKFQIELVGGDVSKTTDKIVIDSIVAGEVNKGKAVLRSGANVGDLIFVTGSLGGAAAGLKLLEEGFSYNSAEKIWRKNLLLKQLQPFPQVSEGLFLSENDLATAMIDLSDGLSSDFGHLCQASRVGAKIYADKIPLHKNLHLIAKSFEEKIDYALNGGEDFELLFTVNPKKNLKTENTLENRKFFCIGEITANIGVIELSVENEVKILQPRGFRHF
jgi:thiamine-monophosphate kinase